MDPEGTGTVSRETIMALFLILNEDFPEINTLDGDQARIVFGLLDKDGSSTITLDEFKRMGKLLLLEFTKESEYTTFVEAHLPRVYESDWYKRFKEIVKSKKFDLVVDIILVMNAVVVGIQVSLCEGFIRSF